MRFKSSLHLVKGAEGKFYGGVCIVENILQGTVTAQVSSWVLDVMRSGCKEMSQDITVADMRQSIRVLVGVSKLLVVSVLFKQDD